MMRSDEQIQRDVLSVLNGDKRLHITDLGVRVDKCVVTLTGTVRTAGERWAALEVARRVAGLAPVSNHLSVRPPDV